MVCHAKMCFLGVVSPWYFNKALRTYFIILYRDDFERQPAQDLWEMLLLERSHKKDRTKEITIKKKMIQFRGSIFITWKRK